MPSGQMQAHAMLLHCSVDLPARALVLNMKHFNGQCGCCYCEDQEKTSPTNRLHRSGLPLDIPCCEHTSLSWPMPRTPWVKEMQYVYIYSCTFLLFTINLHYIYLACQQVKGVKGPSILAVHRPFNLVKGVVVDDLHGIYLGVTRLLLKLWFDKDHRGRDFYIGNKVCSLCNHP